MHSVSFKTGWFSISHSQQTSISSGDVLIVYSMIHIDVAITISSLAFEF